MAPGARTWRRSTATAGTASAARSSSTTAATRRRRSSSRATSTGPDLRHRHPVVPQRRHLRVALGNHRGAHHRGDGGGEAARRGGVVRPELSREALGRVGRAQARRVGARPDRRARGRAGRQRRGPAEGPGDRRAGSGLDLEARSERVLRHDRSRRGALPADQGRRDDAARGALDQPPQLGRGGVDRRPHLGRADVRAGRLRPRGGGDGFASGLIYGLLSGETPDDSVRLGWAHGALIATFPGDTTMATVDQVRAFAKGGSARIQR